MRVIAGNCKGRPLKAVKGMTTRPTTDKVKESIFNMIGPFFQGGVALDLFAGSGSLGIEALSRGVEKAIFVDKDSNAIETIIHNVKQCDFFDQSEIYRNDANRALKAVMKRDLTFSLIFLDPPYKKQTLKDLIEKIDEANLLIDNGFIVTEHDSDIELPDKVGSYIRKKFETYGMTAISIYQPERGII